MGQTLSWSLAVIVLISILTLAFFQPCGRGQLLAPKPFKLPIPLALFVLVGTKITDKALVCLSEFCPRLSDLNLADCKGVTGIGILAFVKKQPALRALTLSRLAGRFVNDAMIKVRFCVSFLPLCSGGVLRFVLCQSP
jgi:hypothetical protein